MKKGEDARVLADLSARVQKLREQVKDCLALVEPVPEEEEAP